MSPQQRRAALAAVPWAELVHAHGPATDVPAQLLAVAEGDAAARADAWEELWQTVHHQGTVYPATVPAVPFLAELAGDPRHPDRVQALALLRELARGDGSAAASVREAVRPPAERLVAAWREEPERVQRALLWLASAYPDLAARHAELAVLLPVEHRAAWALALTGEPPEDDEAVDREDALLGWALDPPDG